MKNRTQIARRVLVTQRAFMMYLYHFFEVSACFLHIANDLLLQGFLAFKAGFSPLEAHERQPHMLPI